MAVGAGQRKIDWPVPAIMVKLGDTKLSQSGSIAQLVEAMNLKFIRVLVRIQLELLDEFGRWDMLEKQPVCPRAGSREFMQKIQLLEAWSSTSCPVWIWRLIT